MKNILYYLKQMLSATAKHLSILKFIFLDKSGNVQWYVGKDDRIKEYTIQLSLLNTLKDKDKVSQNEYETIQSYLKKKYKVA